MSQARTQRRDHRKALTLPVLALIAGLATGASAGPAPPACATWMESDIVVFAEGHPTDEIVGALDSGATCTDVDGDLEPEVNGQVFVEFGPYDPVLACSDVDDMVTVPFNGQELREGAGGGGPGGAERTYIPADPGHVFPGGMPLPGMLRTDCVAGTNLEYHILDLTLTGADGALTGDPTQGQAPTELLLPPNVRGEDGPSLIHKLEIGRFILRQDMDFLTQEDDGPASALRLWPDGLPFRLGPHRKTYTPDRMTFTMDGSLGPTPYAYEPPQWAAANQGVQVPCNPSKPEAGTNPCTGSQAVGNLGYLDASWELAGPGTVDRSGLSVDMTMPAGPAVVYEPLFPRGLWVQLRPPADLSVVGSGITDGQFDSGLAWWRVAPGDICSQAPPERSFVLRTGSQGPQIGVDGSVLAGIDDLNPLDGGSPQPVDWALHSATALGCGTLFTPSQSSDTEPQAPWNRSHVPTVLDRGIYPGINYNRLRVCHDSMGSPVDTMCTIDADCDTGAGEYCADGGFSPLCDPLSATLKPTWNTVIDGEPRSFEIDPDEPGQGDREMAFVLRASGVTGVFDGGDDDFQIPSFPSNPPAEFVYQFDRYGLAYRQSRTRGTDTIVSAEVEIPWPSLTDIPIPEMEVCTCGQPKGGATPENVTIENTLVYWDADYQPHGLNFLQVPPSNQPCADLFGADCDDTQQGQNTAAIVQGVTPIPRLAPDPQSCFGLDPQGNAGPFTPMSGPQLDFDEAPTIPLDPYRFDIEFFELSPWGGQQYTDVVVNGTQPYGYYDLSGEIEVPYFGMTPSGLKIQPDDRNLGDGLGPLHFPVDLHEKGNLTDSAVTVERTIAADSVPVTYELDYFTPDITADPNDGTDGVTVNGTVLGRGKLFAFADEADQSIGAASVAGAMILTPEGVAGGQADLGPAAAMRLWGATDPLWRLAKLPTIMSLSLLQPGVGAQYDAAIASLGHPAWNMPAPSVVAQQLLDTGAIDELDGHPNEEIQFESGDPGVNPPVIGSRVAGYMDLDNAQEQVELFEVVSDQSTGGEFYAFDASLLTVDRHVKNTGMPITTLARADVPGASANMAMPGEQSIPFPAGGGNDFGGSVLPGIEWDFDYDVDTSGPVPQFTFKSLIGTADLTQGGLSGMGFDKMSASLGFYANGDWYFSAGLKVSYSGYGALGDILLGNTQDMTPLREIDPMVAGFLKGVDQFDGAYIRVGIKASLIDTGCLLRVTAGAEVGGWYLGDSFGGKLRGYLYGDGACVVSVRGDLTLLGGEVNDVFKFTGSFWVAGGIGFCDPDGWDSPSDVFDDDFCATCVIRAKLRGRYPPKDLDLRLSGPKVKCTL